MKKKLIYISLLLCIAVLALTTVSAKTMTSDDIPGRTYVIGTHMYDRETNGEYTGTLTTQYIMLGASSIGGDDIQKMIIYYKNPMGEWKNALTNEVIAVPESFDIKYHNGQSLEPTPKVQYGDADNDGDIDARDYRYINQYLLSYKSVDDINVENADVNGDGRITEADKVLLGRYIEGMYPEAKLPEQSLGYTHVIEYFVSGPAYMVDYQLNGYTLVKPTDPTKEGYTFEGWYIDEECTTKFDFTTKVTTNLLLFAKFTEVEVQYGDVNNDGEINTADLVYISKYLAGHEIPESVNITNGDINGDGKITQADLVVLGKYVSGNYTEAKLPEEPLGKTYIIEYIVNGETYELDYELEGYPLYSNQKPTDPTKEGYTFEGWYTDEEYTTKFVFDTTKVTSNLELHAKFEAPKYGDVDANGKIEMLDIVLIKRYLSGYTDDAVQNINKTNADVNGDGRITEADAVLLAKYKTNYYPEAKLPEEPLGKTYIIEYISNDETYKIDYELEGQTLVQPQKPTKEGYTFEGWYTDEECTTKFEFGTDKVTTNLVLFAKFVEAE